MSNATTNPAPSGNAIGAFPTSPRHATPGGTTTPPGFTSQNQSDAFALLSATLTSWGLDSLIPDLRNLIIGGDTNADTLTLALSQTAAYKQRFAANEIRRQKGLPELSPAQYIATEEQYRNALASHGLPAGFYDKPEDFTNMIANDLSPSEVDQRAQIAHDQYMAAPDDWKQLWQSYGFSTGDAIAAILDPTVATQVISDRATQVSIGGAAADQGISVAQPRAQQFQQAGVTLAKARAAYSQIAQSLPTDSAIASRFGQQFGQTQEENDLLLNDAQAANQRRSLYSEEQGLFRSSAATDSNALSISQAH